MIGEVTGMMIATALGWGDAASIALAVPLAFLFGYSLTSLPLVRARLPFAAIVPIALAADRRGKGHAVVHEYQRALTHLCWQPAVQGRGPPARHLPVSER